MTSMDLGRVLIVDDEIELMSALCDILMMQGYEAVGHTSAREALQALQEADFDILLSDLMMPEMDGIALLQAALAQDPQLVGLLMTGQGTVQTAVEAMKVGAFDYLLKPFTSETLLSVLTRAQQMRRLRLENVQLRETLAIYELGQAIAYTLDRSTLVQKIVDAARQQVEAEEASVMLPSPDGETLYVAAVEGPGRQDLIGYRVSMTQSIAGWVGRTRQLLTLQGAVQDPRFAPVKPRDQISSLSLPMLVGGRLVGVLNVNTTRRRRFSLGQVKALSLLANFGAAALENAGLYTELRQAEEKYRSMFEHAIAGMFQSTPEGHFLTVNAGLARMLGYDSAEALMEQINDIAQQLYVDASHRVEFMRQIAECGTVSGFETALYRRNGSVMWMSLSARAVYDAGGALVSYEGISADITERKEAEMQAAQHLARLSLLHQITRAIAERHDLRSIFQVVLHHLERHLPVAFGCFCLTIPDSGTLTVAAVAPGGQASAARVGLQDQTVVSLEQTGWQACMHGETVAVGDTAQTPSAPFYRFAQAELRSLIVTPLCVEDSVSGVLVAARRDPQGFSTEDGEFLRQLSQHVALATRQTSLYEKLNHAYEDLRQTQQVAMQQERLRALGQMASGIAHDINNAISPITLYVESLLASEATLSARACEYLTTVQQAAQDVAHTVARLREFYRQPTELQERLPLDLDEILAQVVELTRAKWRDEPQHQGRTIEVRLALQGAGRARVLGIQSELREAFINLVFNAVDAMPQGGTLTLQTQATPTAVSVEVMDTGIGMDEVTRQRCLEPFYTTKGERGTGLGLAMVYGVLERHEAQLSIDSAVGHGTTMRLLFPRAPSDSTAGVRQVEVEASPAHLRILVVDDDPLLRQSLQHVLQAEGHTVILADGGEAGLAAFHAAQEQQAPFAVVMTDLGMPGMDGREVARVVKHTAPTTPVILLTGWGQALQRERHLPPHVDCLLSKPPRLRELRAALAALTGAEGPAA